MSDVMLMGVLRMPYDMAMGDELTRRQYWRRGQEAADTITTLRAEVERLAKALDVWACACRVDVTMEGVIFRGIERSAAARAWKATLDALQERVTPSSGCVFCDIGTPHPDGIACTKQEHPHAD